MGNVLEILARIHLRKTEDGGRESPISGGYRPPLYFGEKQVDGAVILDGSDKKLTPGEEGEVEIKILDPERVGLEPKIGDPFEIREGRRVVGEGRVLSVLSAGRSTAVG